MGPRVFTVAVSQEIEKKNDTRIIIWGVNFMYISPMLTISRLIYSVTSFRKAFWDAHKKTRFESQL